MVSLCIFLARQTLAQDELTQAAPAPVLASTEEEIALDAGAPLSVAEVDRTYIAENDTEVRALTGFHAGYLVPAGDGYVWTGAGNPVDLPYGPNEDARELKLKVRELADQLFARGTNSDLNGLVAIPSSFVSQDNFQESSSFGRYLAEQLFYELNQRGFPVREYRAGDMLRLRPGQGEVLLTRDKPPLGVQSPSLSVLTGTYYFDEANVFVNARLIKGDTGMVLRTAQLTFPQTYVTRRMLTQPTLTLRQAYVGIQDHETMVQSSTLTDIDLGYDVR